MVDLSQSEMPIVRSCYLWPLMRLQACCWYGHERESGRALCPGMTQTQTYAPDTEPACLKERGQSAGWVQWGTESRRRLGRYSMTDRHRAYRRAGKLIRYGKRCTHIYIWTLPQMQANIHKDNNTKQRWADDIISGMKFNISIPMFSCLPDLFCWDK